MKEKHLLTVLSVEAAACVLFCILQRSVSGLFSTIVAFPFEQLGMGLRALSLSGMAGNGVAIIFYIILCLIPVGIWLLLKKKQKAMAIDFVLFLLSALLFVVLYYMINPGLMDFSVSGTGKWSLGSTLYSVLLGYLLIRALLKYRNAGVKKLQEGLWLLLGAVSIVLVYGIFGQELGQLLLNLESAQTGSYWFLFLQFIIRILPYVLNIIIVFLARRLLTAMKEDLYQEKSVKTADELGSFCMWTLIVTIGLDAGFNLLQLFFQSRLYQIEYVVKVPVFSLAFVLAVLLFARYIREMQRLKADNDLFI